MMCNEQNSTQKHTVVAIWPRRGCRNAQKTYQKMENDIQISQIRFYLYTPFVWECHHPSPPLYFRVFIVCVTQYLPGRSLAFDDRCTCTVYLPLCIVVIFLFYKLNFVNIRAKIYMYCVLFYLFIYNFINMHFKSTQQILFHVLLCILNSQLCSHDPTQFENTCKQVQQQQSSG